MFVVMRRATTVFLMTHAIYTPNSRFSVPDQSGFRFIRTVSPDGRQMNSNKARLAYCQKYQIGGYRGS